MKQNFHLTEESSIKEVSVDDFEAVAKSIRNDNGGEIPLHCRS